MREPLYRPVLQFARVVIWSFVSMTPGAHSADVLEDIAKGSVRGLGVQEIELDTPILYVGQILYISLPIAPH